MKENADKLSDNDRAPVEAAISRAREAMNGDDVQTIRRALDELQAAATAMTQHLQTREPVGAGVGAGGDGQAAQGKDDVIDAEFEVKK